MKYFWLFIIAVILFIITVPIAGIYTFIYYQVVEKANSNKYWYRIAYSIDILANCIGGELLEYLVCNERRDTSYFGKPTTLSAAMGYELLAKNFKDNALWFSQLLDKVFCEYNHCIIAYYKEIGCRD